MLKGKTALPLIKAWKKKRFELVISEALLEELFEVLSRPKFTKYFTSEDIRELGIDILERGRLVDPKEKIDLCRDPKDNIVLECALEGRREAKEAVYLVSEDKDLKDDEELKEKMKILGVKVVGVGEFLEILENKKEIIRDECCS